MAQTSQNFDTTTIDLNGLGANLRLGVEKEQMSMDIKLNFTA